MKICSELNNKKCTFLLDTGADLSDFKKHKLDPNLNINTNETCSIKGIGDGNIDSYGVISAELFLNRVALRQKFHIVPKNFPIPCDGILGIDFIKSFNCSLNYQANEDYLIIRPDGFDNIKIPIAEAPYENWLTLPARAEVSGKVSFMSKEEQILVPSQEISNGVCVAQTIISKQNPYVKILNVNEKILL